MPGADGLPSRHRSSIGVSSTIRTDEATRSLETLIKRVSTACTASLNGELVATLSGIAQFLQDDTSLQDVFRRADGFQTVLGVLNPDTFRREAVVRIGLIDSSLLVISKALEDHSGNQKYFTKRIDGGGWTTLRACLKHAQVAILPLADADKHLSRLYRSLLAMVIGESARESLKGTTSTDDSAHTAKQTIKYPEVLAVVCELALAVVDGSSLNDTIDFQAPQDALERVEALVRSSTRNKVTAHGAGVLSILLTHACGNSTSRQVASVVNELIRAFSDLGFDTLDDVALLFKKASADDVARNLLLETLQHSKGPAFIQFDLTQSGYSSLELPTLPRAFPPAAGYTFTAWLRIDEFDNTCHTTIFGAFDVSQACFVLAYLEKDSHQLILQTSITSSRPSVRFKSTVFKSERWYHVALVHHKFVKDMGSSGAFLFVDGEFAEQVKCQYPEAPPVTSESPARIPPDAPGTQRARPVQAFFGTPHDLALRLGRNEVISQWSLASAYLYQCTLSDEFVAVHHRLGPRYNGNMQDCLGPLLTYRASAELNRYNELLHPEKTEKSDIVTATEGRGSDVVAEIRLLLSVSPSAILFPDEASDHSTALAYDLSKKAESRLSSVSRRSNAIAVNAAVPAVNEALIRSFGAAVLTGEPVIARPQPLDDASWRLGGCLPLVARLVEIATTKTAVLQSVRIFFECIRDSWRISEAMEKGDGFGVLAILLREKLGFDSGGTATASRKPTLVANITDRQDLSYELLELILEFSGYNKQKPEDSMLVNPMAYRVLLVDFDTWRRCDVRTQQLYYSQFGHFVTRNRHQSFNGKRLTRMRIVRRLLDALKVEDVQSETVPAIGVALKALIECSSVPTLYRDLAMFIAFAFQDERAAPSRSLRSMASVASFRHRVASMARNTRGSRPQSAGSLNVPSPKPSISRSELGIRMLELLTGLVCDTKSTAALKRFENNVPHRWMLHLLAETDARILVLVMRILARALLVLGPGFKNQFIHKNGGFVTLKQRLKTLWHVPAIWRTSLGILFGRSSTVPDEPGDLTLFSLVEAFLGNGDLVVAHPEMLLSITAMLETGLRMVTAAEDSGKTTSSDQTIVLNVAIQFLNEVYSRSAAFRDFTVSSRYIQELLFVLFPLIASSDRLSAEMELHSEKEKLNFKGEDVVIRPHSNSLGDRPPSVRSFNLGTDKPAPRPRTPNRVPAPRKTSSFVFVAPNRSKPVQASAHLTPVMAPKSREVVTLNVGNSMVEALLEVVTNIFLDQVCNRKDFVGLGLFLRVPPGFQEHQAYFESYVLLHSMSQLWSQLQLDQKLLLETRVLTNLARYSLHMAEAVFEGWFIEGAQPLLDFIGKVLDYLQQPDIATVKSVRLCAQAVNTMRMVFLRVTLLRLSELDESEDNGAVQAFLAKMNYWQTILFSAENQETPFIRLICYLLYMKLISPSRSVRLAAASLWRTILVQKPSETATLLTFAVSSEQRHLSAGFMKLTSVDDDDFLVWVDENQQNLDTIFIDVLSKPWEDFVAEENRRTEESAKSRQGKRRERLRQWQVEDSSSDIILHRYEVSTNHWRLNVHAQERLKHQRSTQDHQENINHLMAVFTRLEKLLHQPCGLLPDMDTPKWQLDETEAANRMRMRMLIDTTKQEEVYQSKRKYSERLSNGRLSINTHVSRALNDDIMSPIPPSPSAIAGGSTVEIEESGRSRAESESNSTLLEDGFEMVDNPKEDEDGIVEDKNRKIMTSLQRGDEVQQLYNVSRIVGLEACEGLIVVGRRCLYLQDNFFSRSDGEIVSVSQAPADERDPYVQLISGKDVGEKSTKTNVGDQTTRHWTWREVLSISKRRFIFRDVAIEVFFTDGRSYLLTCMTPAFRDELYTSIIKRAPHVHSSTTLSSEDSWRLDSLRNPEEAPQSLGSKFVSVFSQGPTFAATKIWARGEMSNFQYLMLVNTMAGRTFNDLTQYPVFPWVLADYTSEELDLSDPRSFRDLAKPMGCQTSSRESEYQERYQSFAEMGDNNAPPFHYGTHYSSAMIVTSYLIRLQPFVHSYLLLQGGSFDYADRLFDSIEKAWLSTSKENMTDVRELTPEFFYLPEFLTNVNGYDFGLKQGTNEAIDNVRLPRWAKGDPHIFIAKHREALESPYVSQHLHRWIDLIFGYKQRGEAAVDATNVFQHLSYHGAKDLDTIVDPVERLATIGIIHNFGQTPHQVFQKAHLTKEDERHNISRLDTSAESLIRLPDPLFQSGEKVASLAFSPTQERLLCSAPCKLNMMPACDRFVQWGFADHSIRFFSSNSKRIMGLFENTHIGAISAVVFADSKTLVTAGVDSTVAIWTVTVTRDAIDIQPKTYLFGHRTSVTTLTASRVFSTLLSASSDGQVLLWDLNRHDCIRVLLPAGNSRVQTAKISSVTGRIAVCCGTNLLVFTLNGHLLVKQKVSHFPEDVMHCCAFYEGTGNEWIERELILTGHSHGLANIWALTTLGAEGGWHLQLVKRLNHVDSLREDGGNSAAAVTAILPMAQSVYTGDEDGRVWEWDCVQRREGGRR